jgi:hypothetical protein
MVGAVIGLLLECVANIAKTALLLGQIRYLCRLMQGKTRFICKNCKIWRKGLRS